MAAVRNARRAPRREAEVMAAATRVFYERGFGTATVQEVADELDINKGSLYYYIRTKEDLLYRIFDQVHDDVEEMLTEVMDADRLDPLQRIELYVRRQIAYSLEHLERLSVYHQEMDHLTGMRLNEVRDRRRRHDYIVTRLIKEAQAAGYVKAEFNARLLSNCLFAIVVSTHRWFDRGSRVSRKAVVDHCAGFVLRGLAGSLPGDGDEGAGGG
jgi:AcrR family transcriptional regulator